MSIRGHVRLALLDDIGHHRKHRATVLCAGFEDVAERSNSICSAHFLKWQGIPHVGHGVPGVVVRLHFIHVLGEVTNGLIAAASGACMD